MDFFDKNTTALFFVLEQIKNRELIETMFTAISDKKNQIISSNIAHRAGWKKP